MISSVAVFRKDGLLEYDRINLDLRKLLQTVPQEFLEFFESYIETNKRFSNADLFHTFMSESSSKSVKFTQNHTTKWAYNYLEYYKIKYKKSKVGTKRGISIGDECEIHTNLGESVKGSVKDNMLF